MRICIIGKYPPIQGGVSMRTYWTAHGLAARGHDVHVVTNAKEVAPPFRMHMRTQDWQRCEASYGQDSVTVHWTDPVDRSQAHIPMASPFVSKLATLAAGAHSARPFDVIVSHYLEPYGVAGYLAAQMTGVPHVARMAGSDAGRLWHHPQLEGLYDHVLRSAEVVVAAHVVADRAVRRGVDPSRIAAGGGYALPDDLFTPDGPRLDLKGLRAEVEGDAVVRDALWGEFAGEGPYFGIYGKLGDNKGSFAILSALQRLTLAGANVGLVALAHGRPEIERRFRARVAELGLVDRVLQIPFLPHWRVPEFLRGCLAVCCLEQDFPIGFHSPITPLEALLCGACLVGSTEVIRKLPQSERLPHGYGCVAVEDVNDIDELSGKLAAIVSDPEPVAAVGARGRKFACAVQENIEFPGRLEAILQAAARRDRAPAIASHPAGDEAYGGRFPLTRLVAGALAEMSDKGLSDSPILPSEAIDLARAGALLGGLKQAIAAGRADLQPLAQAVEIEVAIAQAESGCEDADDADALFRVRPKRWAVSEGDIAMLVSDKNFYLCVLTFDYDVAAFCSVRTVADLPRAVNPGASYMVVDTRGQREPVLVDEMSARFLQLSDGTRTVGEIISGLNRASTADDTLAWVENLLMWGFIGLRQPEADGRTPD